MTSTANSVLADDSKWLLQTVFGEQWPDAWVCWKSNMTGKRVRNLKTGDLPSEEDCYFCVALLKPGAVRRSLANAKRVYAVVFDDIGTKIDKEDFQLATGALGMVPTWTIETSPGNFQAGYAIEGGMALDDYRTLRDNMKAHPIWGHSDGTDAVHLFRLPQGTNTKHGGKVS